GRKGRVGAHVQAFIGRSRSRIRLARRDAHPGPPAWKRRKRGTRNQAIGKSRGGLTTKIAALFDALGNVVPSDAELTATGWLKSMRSLALSQRRGGDPCLSKACARCALAAKGRRRGRGGRFPPEGI